MPLVNMQLLSRSTLMVLALGYPPLTFSCHALMSLINFGKEVCPRALKKTLVCLSANRSVPDPASSKSTFHSNRSLQPISALLPTLPRRGTCCLIGSSWPLTFPVAMPIPHRCYQLLSLVGPQPQYSITPFSGPSASVQYHAYSGFCVLINLFPSCTAGPLALSLSLFLTFSNWAPGSCPPELPCSMHPTFSRLKNSLALLGSPALLLGPNPVHQYRYKPKI